MPNATTTATPPAIPAEFEGLIDPSPDKRWSNVFYIHFVHNGQDVSFCVWPEFSKDLVTSNNFDAEMRASKTYNGDSFQPDAWLSKTGVDSSKYKSGTYYGYSTITLTRAEVIDILAYIKTKLQPTTGFSAKPLAGFTVIKRQEKPCPRCGRMNDLGVKECWHCEMPNP